jgi:hypothetical protein
MMPTLKNRKGSMAEPNEERERLKQALGEWKCPHGTRGGCGDGCRADFILSREADLRADNQRLREIMEAGRLLRLWRFATARELRDALEAVTDLYESLLAATLEVGGSGKKGIVYRIEKARKLIDAFDHGTPPESWKRTMDVVEYADHKSNCRSVRTIFGPCTCGFADALRRLEEG